MFNIFAMRSWTMIMVVNNIEESIQYSILYLKSMDIETKIKTVFVGTRSLYFPFLRMYKSDVTDSKTVFNSNFPILFNFLAVFSHSLNLVSFVSIG